MNSPQSTTSTPFQAGGVLPNTAWMGATARAELYEEGTLESLFAIAERLIGSLRAPNRTPIQLDASVLGESLKAFVDSTRDQLNNISTYNSLATPENGRDERIGKAIIMHTGAAMEKYPPQDNGRFFHALYRTTE